MRVSKWITKVRELSFERHLNGGFITLENRRLRTRKLDKRFHVNGEHYMLTVWVHAKATSIYISESRDKHE